MIEVGIQGVRRFRTGRGLPRLQLSCVRSAVHGFASLEVAGGFGLAEDVDISYERLIHLVAGSLTTPRSHVDPLRDLP